jgi:hypothetical protein
LKRNQTEQNAVPNALLDLSNYHSFWGGFYVAAAGIGAISVLIAASNDDRGWKKAYTRGITGCVIGGAHGIWELSIGNKLRRSIKLHR